MTEQERHDDEAQGRGSEAEPEPETGAVEPEPEEVPEAEESGHEALADALRTSFRFLKYVMVIMVVGYVLTGIFWIHEDEVKVKMRFGRVVPGRAGELVLTSESGPQIRWPWEDVRAITTEERSLDIEKAFWPDLISKRKKVEGLDVRKDGFLITGDANIVHVKFRVRYRLGRRTRDILGLLFSVGEDKVEAILEREAMRAATKVFGSMSVDLAIKKGSQSGDQASKGEGVFRRIQQSLRDGLREFEDQSGCSLGVDLDNLVVESIAKEDEKNPSEPAATREAFMAAQNAESKMEELKLEGETKRSEIIKQAETKAHQIVEKARAHAHHLVTAAKADAKVLQTILQQINAEDNPAERRRLRQVLTEQLYLRTVEEVFIISPAAIVLHEPDGDATRELRLILGKFAATRIEGME